MKRRLVKEHHTATPNNKEYIKWYIEDYIRFVGWKRDINYYYFFETLSSSNKGYGVTEHNNRYGFDSKELALKAIEEWQKAQIKSVVTIQEIVEL